MTFRCLPLRAAMAFAMCAAALAVPVRADAQATPPVVRVQPAPDVDLERYGGRWYEIARYPNKFQQACTGNVVAEYSRRPDGRLNVRNSCITASGPVETSGVARKAHARGPSSVLEVRFAPAIVSWLPSVWGDYWILDLAADYSTAVVGDPTGTYLWLLSRTPRVDGPTYARMVDAARRQGFDIDRLVRTPQDVP